VRFLDLKQKWCYSPNKERTRLGTYYDAKLGDHGEIYLLIQEASSLSSVLIKVDKDGREIFRRDIDFGVNSIDINQDGIYLAGFHYRDAPNKSGVIYTPDVALLNKDSKIIWHIVPSPPFEVEELGKKESIWDLSSVGDIELWKVHALSEGGCVLMGKAESDQDSFLYHFRLDKQGKKLWDSCIPAYLNWMYFYPNKVEPHLEVRQDSLFSIGATVLKSIKSQTSLSVVKFRLSDGTILQQFSHGNPYNYTCSAVNPETGDIAIGYSTEENKGGILILNDNVSFITNLDSPITPWMGIEWADDNKVWVGGTVGGRRMYVEHPGCALIEYNESGIMDVKFKKIFFEDRVHDRVKISPIQNGCFMSYTVNKSEKDDIIDKTEVVVRKLTMDESVEHRFIHTEAIHDKVRLIPTVDGHFVICNWNSYYPILCKY